jgi:hypothetical protein
VTMASFAGLSHYPWAYARFFVFALPLLLLILAEGVTTAPGARSPVLCGAAALFVLATWSPDLRRLFEQKSNRPWSAIATFLRTHMEPPDLLVASGSGDLLGSPAVNLAPYLGDRARNFQSVSSFLAPGKAGNRGRIFFIQPHEPIITEAPSWRFGTVHIVTYAAPTRAAEAEALLTDLEQSLQGKISDTRVGDYRLVLELLAALGRPDVGSKNTERYYECLMRTPRQRWAPRQMLGIPADRE